jgi:hypothetical protein
LEQPVCLARWPGSERETTMVASRRSQSLSSGKMPPPVHARIESAMTISALKPFIPSGKDFATARRFFVDLG